MNISTPYRTQEEGSLASSSFYNQVYAWMCAGLAITAGVAAVTAGNIHLMKVLQNGWALAGIIILQLILVGVISAATKSLNSLAATVLFLLYAAMNGLTLSVIFLVYAKSTIASAFLVSAGTFGAFSVYGAVTKKDLTAVGSLCIMALFGLIVAMIVNIFVANSFMDWIINIFGVLIFVGLTAYDTQKLRDMARQGERMAIVGSLTLYLDFVNLFLFILKLMGGKSKD